MNESAARVAVIVAVTLTVVLETVAVALTLGVGALDQALIYAVYAIVQVLAGAAVVWSHPRHRVGWLLVVFSLFNATFTDALLAYGKQAALHGWPAAAPAQVVALSGWMVAALGLVLLFLWFPDGRVRGPGRWIPWVGALGALLGLPGWALNPRLSPSSPATSTRTRPAPPGPKRSSSAAPPWSSRRCWPRSSSSSCGSEDRRESSTSS
jgi:hypothetical protein